VAVFTLPAAGAQIRNGRSYVGPANDVLYLSVRLGRDLWKMNANPAKRLGPFAFNSMKDAGVAVVVF